MPSEGLDVSSLCQVAVGQCVQDSVENTNRGNSFLCTFYLTLPNEAGKKFSCVLCFARSHVISRSIGNRFLTGRSFIKTCRPSMRVLVCLSVFPVCLGAIGLFIAATSSVLAYTYCAFEYQMSEVPFPSFTICR